MIQDSLMGPKFNKVVATSAPRMQETWAGGGPPLWRSRFQLISLTAAVLPHPASYHLRSLPVQSSRVSVSPKFPSLMFTLPEKLSNLGRNRSQGGRSAAQQKEPVSSFPSSGPRVSLRPSLYLYTNSSDGASDRNNCRRVSEQGVVLQKKLPPHRSGYSQGSKGAIGRFFNFIARHLCLKLVFTLLDCCVFFSSNVALLEY